MTHSSKSRMLLGVASVIGGIAVLCIICVAIGDWSPLESVVVFGAWMWSRGKFGPAAPKKSQSN
jgi:hypothetical protein